MTVVDQARDLLQKAIKEIDHERDRLSRALAELGGSAPKAGKRPGRPPGKAPSKATGKRRRRSRKGGTRGDQAVALIQESPGISASEIAKKLKIKPNYLYRVLNDEVKAGKIKKDGRSYKAV